VITPAYGWCASVLTPSGTAEVVPTGASARLARSRTTWGPEWGHQAGNALCRDRPPVDPWPGAAAVRVSSTPASNAPRFLWTGPRSRTCLADTRWHRGDMAWRIRRRHRTALLGMASKRHTTPHIATRRRRSAPDGSGQGIPSQVCMGGDRSVHQWGWRRWQSLHRRQRTRWETGTHPACRSGRKKSPRPNPGTAFRPDRRSVRPARMGVHRSRSYSVATQGNPHGSPSPVSDTALLPGRCHGPDMPVQFAHPEAFVPGM